MTLNIVIIGAGGHGRECLGIAEAMIAAGSQISIAGFLDDRPSDADVGKVRRRGYALLGPTDALDELPSHMAVLGVGSSQSRALLAERLTVAGIDSPVLVHPDATIGAEVVLAPGCVVFAGARITTNVSIGAHTYVSQNSTVAHDCVIGSHVSVNPMAAISGNVRIGSEVLIGAGATVLEGLTIGSRARVAAAACVVGDVRDDQTVKGVPAK